MQYGFSFSVQQCNWLELDWKNLLIKLSKSNLKKIRLSLYWNEIEKQKDLYNFAEAKKLIDFAAKLNFEIILTVGVKAQRWPEFYFPKYIEQENLESEHFKERLLLFIEKSIDYFKDIENITTWQVENEPLSKSGPKNQKISIDLLQQQIDLVRRLDSTRKILVTEWGNDLWKRRSVKNLYKLKNIDMIGFDFYPKRPSLLFFSGPDLSLKNLSKLAEDMKSKGISPIIAELQAEPWEQGFDYKKSPERIKSVSLEQIKRNVDDYKNLGFDEILLWGVEYCEWAGILDDLVQFLT